MDDKIAEFYAKKHNLEIEGYLGSGEFGTAYYTNNDKVIKITTSSSEIKIVKKLKGKKNHYIADYYDYAVIKYQGHTYYAILMELLDNDCSIEDLYGQMTMLFDEFDVNYSYPQYFDIDEVNEKGIYPDEEVLKFIEDYTNVVSDVNHYVYHNDFSPDNLGYKANGNLAAFDLMSDYDNFEPFKGKDCTYNITETKKTITNLLRESLLRENISSIEDFNEILIHLPYEIFLDIKSGTKITFKPIPPLQYTRALQEFMKYGELFRFPPRLIYKWKELVLYNIAQLEVINSINGHSSHFPSDEFLDVFDYDEERGGEGYGEFSQWLKTKDEYDNKYDYSASAEFLDDIYNYDDVLPLYSNGQFMISDYGLPVLLELADKLIPEKDINKILVLINRILDVTHPRSDLAELFIEGGSETLDKISN
jgi:hypothetical protein